MAVTNARICSGRDDAGRGPSPHSLATASGLLLGALAMIVGALVGWLFGASGIGLLVGALVGIPLGVLVVYQVYGRGRTERGIFSTPRPVPSRLAPTVAGGLVIALALPVFAVAGWPVSGWALAAVLWVAAGLRAGTGAPPGSPDNLAAAGMRGIGTTSRALLVGIPLVIVTVTDETVGVAAAIVYALAFTVELGVGSPRTSAGGKAHEAPRVVRLPAGPGAVGCARTGRDHRGEQGRLHLGGVGAARVDPDPPRAHRHVDQQGGGVPAAGRALRVPHRDRADARPGRTRPNRRQALGETIYEIAQVQVAEQGLPTKAIGRWFPYVASLMIFIWTVNMLGFIPLPLSDEKFTIAGVELPTLAIFAATSTLSVTLALALMTFVFTHVEGIRANGSWNYFKSWIPDVPKGMLPLIVPLEILGQFMRLISLSVRLYANMLAGHMLILTFVGLIIVLENVFLAIVAVPAAALFYLFEVVIVVSIQAYIFAALSAIYIGSAIEPEH